jgi:hypothetical protein
LFPQTPSRTHRDALPWNVTRACRVILGNESRRLLDGFAMTEAELLQFEVIRTIAASLIGVAIVLLWLVAISRQ